MIIRTTLASFAVLAVLAGCNSDPNAKSQTGPYVTPDYSGSHYNGAVNSGGSGIGMNNPAVNGAATGEMNGGTRDGTSTQIGQTATGTSDQNGGSGSPSGATGNSAASGR